VYGVFGSSANSTIVRFKLKVSAIAKERVACGAHSNERETAIDVMSHLLAVRNVAKGAVGRRPGRISRYAFAASRTSAAISRARCCRHPLARRRLYHRAFHAPGAALMQNHDDTMRAGRRRFLQTSALGAASLPAMMLAGNAGAAEASGHDLKLPKSILALQPVAPKVVPISDDERRARMARAQQLMDKNGMDAIFVDAGTTLDYFTGLRWWNSERTMGMLLPKAGDPVYIVPQFERSRTQGQIRIGSDVRTWQENESPYALIANVMRERHAGTGVLGIEDRVPFYRATKSARHCRRRNWWKRRR
jgi:hypothetical protein